MSAPINIVNYLQLLGPRVKLAMEVKRAILNCPPRFADLESVLVNEKLSLHPSLIKHIESILVKENVLSKSINEWSFSRQDAVVFFEKVEVADLARIYDWPRGNAGPILFASPPSLIPASNADEIDDIRNLLTNLISSSRRSINILSPFTTVQALAGILQPLNLNDSAVEVNVLMSDSNDVARRQSNALMSTLKPSGRHKFNFYSRSNESISSQALLHAKVLTVDGDRGYLGSANFTQQGIERHFELGVELSTRQTALVNGLIDSLIHDGTFRLIRTDEG